MDLKTFLVRTKKSLVVLDNYKNVFVILGNESCDLDSAVSSITYAFSLNQKSSDHESVFIPVLNIPLHDYELRTEIKYFFTKIGIHKEDIVFRNQIDLKSQHRENKLSLILVDHNYLGEEDEYLMPCVTEIIDHHKVTASAFINKSVDCIGNTIEMVGSCSTLIAEKLLNTIDVGNVDRNIPLLLYGTILLDTINFSTSAGKTTAKDINMCSKLKSFLPVIDSDELYGSLHDAKFCVEDLSVDQILRKDMKEVSNSSLKIGISSITISLESLAEKIGSSDVLDKFCESRCYQVLVIMAITVGETVSRQVAVFSTFDSYREQVEDVLEQSVHPSLQLEYLKLELKHATAFNQTNTKASRKVILPLIHKFLLGDDSPASPGYESFSKAGSSADAMLSPAEENQFRNENENVTSSSSSFKNIDYNLIVPMTNGLTNLSSCSNSGVQSQNSSSQNSGLYTPYNSYVGGSLDMDAYARRLLPSFNSRDMVKRIEMKRENLSGATASCDIIISNSVPFTPKNSFVESSSMELYSAQYELRNLPSDELVAKVKQKIAEMTGFHDNIDDFHEVAFDSGYADISEAGSSDRVRSTDSLSMGFTSPCPNIHSSTEDCLREDKVKCDNSSVISEKTPVDENLFRGGVNSSVGGTSGYVAGTSYGASDSQSEQLIEDKSKDIDDKCNDEINEEARENANYNTDSTNEEKKDLNKSYADEPQDASNYTAQTVDFPDSPHQLKILRQKSYESQGPKPEEVEDNCDRATVSPSNESITFKKAI